MGKVGCFDCQYVVSILFPDLGIGLNREVWKGGVAVRRAVHPKQRPRNIDLDKKKWRIESTYHIIRQLGWIGRVKWGGIGGIAVLDV